MSHRRDLHINWSAQWRGPVPNPSRFRCQLDDQPAFLVPPRLLTHSVSGFAIGSLIVNPYLWWSRLGNPPTEIVGWTKLAENFDWRDEAVWITDQDGEVVLPFTLGSTYRALTEDFCRGRSAPEGLPSHALAILEAARILVVPDLEERRRDEWRSVLADCARQFQYGYAVVAGLIHPFHLGELRRYCRYLIRSGRIQLGDGQSPRRYVAHNESVAQFFHWQLSTVVSTIVGEPVKPSYCYLASYQSGAMLPRHTDRPQCQFTVTVLVDSSPEPAVASPWPLHLEISSNEIKVYQAIGDGLVYRGCEIPHYRTTQPSGRTSTSIFFHYVPESFRGSLE